MQNHKALHTSISEGFFTLNSNLSNKYEINDQLLLIYTHRSKC